jgi:two-component system LytT family sensor kinase
MIETPDSQVPETPKRRLSMWLILPAIYTVPAVFSAVLIHSRYLQLGRESVLWRWLLDFSLGWYIWAALTPLVVWLGRKLRIERTAWVWSLSLHFFIALILAIFQISLAVVFSILVYAEPLTWEYIIGQIVPTIFSRLLTQILVYFVILGISYAIEYQRQSSERAVRATRLEGELSKARLDALQQQLQPHFLFNTLNSISVLMQKGEITVANSVLNDLSDLLRQVLRKENVQVVTLAEELEFVRRYAAIEQVRYGDRLQVEFDVPNDLLTIAVPSFILQLLVENAIRHGVTKKADSGKVGVHARCVDSRLRLTVIDDGVGIDSAAFSEGVGISNARSRLQYLYGESHKFEIRNNENTGVAAMLEIPVESKLHTKQSHLG